MDYRLDREDTSAQLARVTEARTALGVALSNLALAAKRCAVTCANKRGNPDLPQVYALVNDVRRAEEAVDMAALDLSTARGEDA